ncbi:MAG: type II secretion system minor pseudopilin GspJ [Aquirhabdus sp.]
MNTFKMTHTNNKGFTLIELVVAMAIFAVLTLSGWRVFDNLIKVRERTSIRAEQIAAIQETYEQLSRDFAQTIPRPAAIGNTVEPAFLLQNNVFHLTKTGVIDPLQQGVSPLERVYYSVEQEQLIRHAVAQVDQNGNLVPTTTVLLNHVKDWTVGALDSSSNTAWPVNNSTPATSTGQTAAGDVTMPKAVQVSLTVNGQPLRWLFALVNNLPQPNTATGSTNPNGTPVTGGASAAATNANTNQTPPVDQNR